MSTAKKLLSIQNDQLVLNDLINIKNSYVISIVGNARKGKSTFLNIMLNFLILYPIFITVLLELIMFN